MSSNGHPGPASQADPETTLADGPPLTRWQKVRLVIKVVELRLRFIALMGATGLGFAYWDTIANRYDKWMRPAAGRVAAASGIEHYCPMHPSVVQEELGTCPICGMPLARRRKGEKATLPEGVISRVPLTPARLAQAGVRTVAVGYAPLTQSLTTVGSVAFDERRLAVISSKVPGRSRVEKLLANYTGMDVMAGEPLAELYNAELAQAVQELLIAQRSGQQATAPQSASARALLGDRRDMVRLSAEKLRRWGITQAQVDAILAEGKADSKIPILSPITGHLVRKNVVEGQEVSEGTAMFEVADLSEVWILAQVYERQVGLVRPGQAVEATVEAYPGQVFPGRVEFMQPHLDPATRSVEVRFAVANPGHRLRPGMFAAVTLRTPVADTPAFLTRAATGPASAGLGRLASLGVEQQKTCPVTGAKLGSMGEPFPVEVGGRRVWTCCSGCEAQLKADPARYLAKFPAAADRPAADASSPTVEDQKVCPVTTAKLGSMGEPIPVGVEGRRVWTCCAACPPKLKAEPARYLARLAPAPRDEVLSVPESAVIDTGSRMVVYVEAEPGVFEGRRVVLGPRIGDRFPVLEGLAPGEKVAAAGAFLIDAESRLNSSEAPASPVEGGPPRSPEPTPRSAAAPAEGAHRH